MELIIEKTINNFFNIKPVITINFIPGISISSIITNSQTEISVKKITKTATIQIIIKYSFISSMEQKSYAKTIPVQLFPLVGFRKSPKIHP